MECLKNKISSKKEATKIVPFTQFVKKPNIMKEVFHQHIMQPESDKSENGAEYEIHIKIYW